MTLYVVVRNDIPPGLQMAQACHATREFTLYSDVDPGDNLVVLGASPAELAALLARVAEKPAGCSEFHHPYAYSPFHEPDLGGELTALALVGSGARKMLSSFPLALRGVDSPGLSALTL